MIELLLNRGLHKLQHRDFQLASGVDTVFQFLWECFHE